MTTTDMKILFCTCKVCGDCRYVTYNKESKAKEMCFACRKGVHSGKRP